MPTFKAEIQKHQKRADGTYNVKIRITHGGKAVRIPTPFYVSKEDVIKSLKIKNQIIIDKTDELIKKYRDECNNLELQHRDMPVSEVAVRLKNLLERRNGENYIDFIAFARSWIEKNKDKKGIKNYKSTINSLIKHTGTDKLNILDINFKFLTKYANYINKQKEEKNKQVLEKGERVTTNRALSLYLGNIRHLHNEAKKEYNDEDIGKIPIPLSPFSKFSIHKPETTRKRAISAELIKKIYLLPDKMVYEGSKGLRYNLAKDMFIMSFCLLGMNSIDIFTCNIIKDNVITYFRSKTKDRRSDNAEIQVKIHPFLYPLYEKYSDTDNKFVFNIYKRYSTYQNFNSAINIGLKEIGRELGIEDLEFYSGRHSFATIALNDVGIDKYTVHAALNHIDETMRVTDIYIKKDFTAINEANRKVIEYVFEK
ncbi:hypothetical protein EZS27_023192 [termite gut metagenome]|uniref:Phage integrase SAM-like domain-containing protein n=1 Tax=termite gut metagenome TaxID=433724 RepID=A0A5J4R2C1_9ZZZZ